MYNLVLIDRWAVKFRLQLSLLTSTCSAVALHSSRSVEYGRSGKRVSVKVLVWTIWAEQLCHYSCQPCQRQSPPASIKGSHLTIFCIKIPLLAALPYSCLLRILFQLSA
ncbi:hypothetical protein BDR07DRAFT_263651 [Suillus spraguei]|nr:hypothetical protein BDR07DRAFT_263651 [Suillus spraguei]